jgi:hypothetical protein
MVSSLLSFIASRQGSGETHGPLRIDSYGQGRPISIG